MSIRFVNKSDYVTWKEKIYVCFTENPCNDYCENSAFCTATCTDTSCDTPICTCLDGYTDDRCTTIVIDPCKPNPCVNGNCTKTINGEYSCQCNTNYIGHQCDKSKSK